MTQGPDRIRLRREYLQKRKKANSQLGVAYFMVCVCVSGLYFFAVSAVHSPDARSRNCGWLLFVLTCMASIVYVGCFPYALKARKEVDQQFYAPPVEEYSPEEILVRGSEEPPVVQREVLLRAAQSGHDIATEELLRVSQGE